MKQVVLNAIEFVKKYFENESSGHDYFHTIRVYKMACHIAEKENADKDIVSLAALLHDVDDIKLSPNTNKNKDNARRFLKENHVDENTINLICEIISEISYKGVDTVPGKTLEAKIVQDADRLDAIGAIGIARTFTYGGYKNNLIYDPDIKPIEFSSLDEVKNKKNTTINHFYEKLLKLKDLMNTSTAKEIAKRRHDFMVNFLDEFYFEWDFK